MNDLLDTPLGRGPELGASVVIAGGGVAALEGMLALRALAGEHVTIEVLAPESEFVYRPLSVTAPFGLGEPLRLDLGELVRRAGARLHGGALASVDPARKHARTAAGAELPYDYLLVAAGGGRRDPLVGSLAFGGEGDVEAFRGLLDEVERGDVRRLVFALTGARQWSLPLYELALMTAAFVAVNDIRDAELTLITPEHRPLEIFGPEAAGFIELRLKRAGVALRTGEHALRWDRGVLHVIPDGAVGADRVVTLAAPAPPVFRGLPADSRGFIPTDRHGRVDGLTGVYAAGDITTFPLKQGGIAAQQADAAAEHIAASARALVTPRPFRPVLRGMLLTGERSAYLRGDIPGTRAARGAVDLEPLWWPPAKIVAKYLGPYLAEQAGVPNPVEIRDAEGLLVAWEADHLGDSWDELDARESRAPA